jgi:hypothetical protein
MERNKIGEKPWQAFHDLVIIIIIIIIITTIIIIIIIIIIITCLFVSMYALECFSSNAYL